MKKIATYTLLALTTLPIAPIFASANSEGLVKTAFLDYDNACNFKKSFKINAGDSIYFQTYLDVGDLLSIKTTVTNPDPGSKRYRWHFVNYNKKRFSRKYFKVFKTRLRIGSNPGWFEFYYRYFAIPDSNTVRFRIKDLTYCKRHHSPKPKTLPVHIDESSVHKFTEYKRET